MRRPVSDEDGDGLRSSKNWEEIKVSTRTNFEEKVLHEDVGVVHTVLKTVSWVTWREHSLGGSWDTVLTL